MQKFFQILVIGIILFLIIFLVAVGIGYALNIIFGVIPCEIYAYVTTGLLFIIALLIGLIISKQ